jgi:ribA/ribD-fused uncharacterized protein
MDDPCEQGGYVLFWAGWPSNWHHAPFRIGSVRYTCCEQYMMAEKARLFGDEATRAKILASETPKEQKRLGRLVKPYDDHKWMAVSREVVYQANLAKYRAHADLRELLLGTGDKVLAEASPLDMLWGIGLAASHPDATSPGKWPGKNWLGEVLMRVRATLRTG